MPPVPQKPVEKPAAAAKPAEQGKYTVTCAGAPYKVDGDPAYIQIAMQNHVIDLVDEEAERLILLGAVRAATDDEVIADMIRRSREAEIDARNASGPDSNPFGGRVVGTSLEAHAAEQIALAKKAGSKSAAGS